MKGPILLGHLVYLSHNNAVFVIDVLVITTKRMFKNKTAEKTEFSLVQFTNDMILEVI